VEIRTNTRKRIWNRAGVGLGSWLVSDFTARSVLEGGYEGRNCINITILLFDFVSPSNLADLTNIHSRSAT